MRKSHVDLALLVEKNQHIDSDLVAALQFERPDAAAWGSPALETAVIEYVDDFSSHLNVFEGFSHRRLKRRLTAAGVALGLALLWTAIFPRHVGAFLSRFLLGSAHYPTATIIVQIRVAGVTTLGCLTTETAAPGVRRGLRRPRSGQAPHGEPLVFDVLCRGVLPESGTIELRSLESGTTVELPLAKIATPGRDSTAASEARPVPSFPASSILWPIRSIWATPGPIRSKCMRSRFRS